MSALVGAISLALMVIGAMRVLRAFGRGTRRVLAYLGRQLAKLDSAPTAPVAPTVKP